MRVVAAGLLALAAVAALAGIGLGSLRIAAIDSGALGGTAGQRTAIVGTVTAPPRRSYGEVRVEVETPRGRVVLVAPEPVADLTPGEAVAARGTLRDPDDFRADELRRAGAAFELAVARIRPVTGGRAGLAGALDRIRGRAETALGAGLDPDQEALARGFVLGQDDRIDPLVREQFHRAGLSHLLAVSGQNVILLAILAGAGLALFGFGLRVRLAATVVLIGLYVPIAGAGPSIQRAGVMGAAAILATLAGRPAGRAWPPLLAAVATLLINPRFGGDVGWQLSFAAVLGIMLWGGPLRDLIADRLPARLPAAVARGIADGAAVTLAATIATAPLIAHDFERISLASIPANLLALPAIAPVMWVGMTIGLLGQIPGFPTAPLGAVEGALIDYVALVARVFGSAGWAEAQVSVPGPAGVVAGYLLCSAAAGVLLAALRRRRRLAIPIAVRVAASAIVLAGLAVALVDGRSSREPPDRALRVTGLDVGQGDAILLEPPRASAGPDRRRPTRRRRRRARPARGRPPGGRLRDPRPARPCRRPRRGPRDAPGRHARRGRPAPRLEAAARAAGTRVLAVAEGSSLRFGASARRRPLAPARARPAPATDPNDDSLVLAASFGAWDVLLTGDAEPEATHLRPRARSTSSRSPTTAARTPGSTRCSIARCPGSP